MGAVAHICNPRFWFKAILGKKLVRLCLSQPTNQVWCHTPVISNNQEAIGRRIAVLGLPRKKFQTLSEK
jgi:hypothetical protein